MKQQELELLKQSLEFWDKLSREQQDELAVNTTMVHYPKGMNIHGADQDCVGVIVIAEGELRSYLLSDEGREVTLYRLGKGDVCVFSASCILKNITFDIFLDAEQDTSVLLVNAPVFSRLIQENVYAENFSLRVAADRFSDVMWAMEQMLFMSFDRRLAVFLLDETAKQGTDTIDMTHEQIAKYIGSAREVVSRMVKHFVKEGLLESRRGTLRILNRDGLKKYR